MNNRFLIFVVFAALTATAPRGQTSTASDTRALQLITASEREIAGGETHAYEMHMISGQYIRIAFDPRGSVLRVKLTAPDGTRIIDLLAPNAGQDPARVSWIAQASGRLLIELTPAKSESPSKRYAIRIEELRVATTADEQRVAAERLNAEAESLRAAGSCEALSTAIDKYRSSLDLWRTIGDRREEARTLLILASVSHNLSRPAEALRYYSQSLFLWRSLGDRSREAQILSGIGWTYFSIGDLQRALDHYNQALAIRRELRDLKGQAQTLTTIGQIYKSIGDPQRAIDHYSQSLPLAREVGDKIQEAFALTNFAYLYLEIGEHQKALDYVDEALPLWRETDNRYGEADALNNAGMIYDTLGDFEKSLEYYRRSLDIWRFVGNRLGEADVLNNMGVVYTSMGHLQSSTEQLQKAVDYLNQALALRRTTGQRLGEDDTLNCLGLVYEYLGERDRARDYFNQVLAIDARSPAALHNIGLNYYLRGNYQRALEYCLRALSIFRERGNKTGEALTLRIIAGAESNLGNLREAVSNARAALHIIESLRAKVAGSDLRTSYQGLTRDYYVLLIDILLKQHQLHPTEGNDAAALEISERGRARGLLELLSEGRIAVREGVDPMLLQREVAVERQLNAKEQYRMRLLNDRRAGVERSAVENEITYLTNESHEIRARVRASSPKYAALTQPATFTLKQIQQTLLDDHTILLEYCLGQSRSFLWAVTPTSISSHTLPDKAEIEAVARRVYDSLTARNNHPPDETREQRVARINQADAEYKEAAAALSQTLLGPVVSQLADKRLVFVTEGLLQYIPFGALPQPIVKSPASINRMTDHGGENTHQQKPLLADHEIVNLPSASVLAALRRELASRKVPAKSVAVVADPVFSKDDPRVDFKLAASASRSLPGNRSSNNGSRVELPETEGGTSIFGRLRFSREEAENIIALAPAGMSLKALDFAANRRTVTTANLDQYRILHFATHGLLNSERPELSGLVLSLVDEKGQPQDGFLGLREIYNLRLNTDLVVLSGCRTALGKEIKGEGLVGLTRGFMYAGAARIVASLWNVDDRATAELMKRFYRGLLSEGMRPAAALKAAQSGLLKEPGWGAPYYWAGFVLQGDWN